MSHRRPDVLLAVVFAAAAFVLGACSQYSALNYSGGTAVVGVGGYDVAQAPSPNPDQSNPQIARRRLAITHAFNLHLSSADVESVQQKHLAECGRLGCTVVSTRIDRSNEGRITARSSIRIAPDAFAAFAAILAAPPAKIVTHSETTDDRTIAVLDVEKRLEVKSALRDRLAAMLREPGTKSAGDLATIEKELAQVQGDIEAIAAQRDYLRTLTETVRVDIDYVGLAAQAGGFDLSPITGAIDGIGETLVRSVAALISFLAATIPWIPLLALVAWATRRGIRRWKARKAPA